MVVLSGGRPTTLKDIDGPIASIVATCLGRMMNWWKLVETVLQTEISDWGLLLQFTAFHTRLDLAINHKARGQLQTLSDAFGMDSDRLVSKSDALCPIADQFANKLPNASDCVARYWRTALALAAGGSRRKTSFPSLRLQHILSRFVTYVGSSSGAEQTLSKCLSQFRHLRNFKVMGFNGY